MHAWIRVMKLLEQIAKWCVVAIELFFKAWKKTRSSLLRRCLTELYKMNSHSDLASSQFDDRIIVQLGRTTSLVPDIVTQVSGTLENDHIYVERWEHAGKDLIWRKLIKLRRRNTHPATMSVFICHSVRAHQVWKEIWELLGAILQANVKKGDTSFWTGAIRDIYVSN